MLDTNNCSNLNKLIEDLSSNITFVYDLIETNEFYNSEIDKNNQVIRDEIRDKIINSCLNEKLKLKLNLGTAKLLTTSNMMTKKLAELLEVKQSYEDPIDSKLVLSDWSHIFNTFIDQYSIKDKSNETLLLDNQMSLLLQQDTDDELFINNSLNQLPYHESIRSFIENIKKIEFILKQTKQLNICNKNENLDLITELNDFFNKLNQFINNDKQELINDLCLVCFDFIIMAKSILNSFKHQDQSDVNKLNNYQALTVKSEEEEEEEEEVEEEEREEEYQFEEQLKIEEEGEEEEKEIIKFSFDPVLNEPVVAEFNKNIISLKVNKLLEQKSASQKLNEQEKIVCEKCTAYFSLYSQVIAESNQWICNICWNVIDFPKNTKISALNNIDVEFMKSNNDIKTEKLKKNLDNNTKIIVFCIDISGSMAGSRINMVKDACINTINVLKDQNPDYKVALITFESRSKYYGHGNIYESTVNAFGSKDISKLLNHQDKVKSLAKDLLPIKESYELLISKIKSLTANGGTSICSALSHSVFLASSLPNSEIILCTDGCADDKSEIFYNSVTDYCNSKGFIKINIISFDETDVDLELVNIRKKNLNHFG
jgi:hypothetical protein